MRMRMRMPMPMPMPNTPTASQGATTPRGWFPHDTAWGYDAVIGVFLAIGAVLWTVLYFIFTRLVPRKPETTRLG